MIWLLIIIWCYLPKKYTLCFDGKVGGVHLIKIGMHHFSIDQLYVFEPHTVMHVMYDCKIATLIEHQQLVQALFQLLF
jgi:hypothetical protein